MEYVKPELIALPSAVNAIQGGKGISLTPDSSQHVTAAAYEADE
jgi:hypothetical protein